MSTKLQGHAARRAASAEVACMLIGSSIVTPLYALYRGKLGFSEVRLAIGLASGASAAWIADLTNERRARHPYVGVHSGDGLSGHRISSSAKLRALAQCGEASFDRYCSILIPAAFTTPPHFLISDWK